ncbi:MAG: NAD-binding protein [bacterium]
MNDSLYTQMPRRKRILRRISEFEWPIIWCLAAGALALGIVGFGRLFADMGQADSLRHTVYATIQLFVLEFSWYGHNIPWELNLARYLAPGVAAYTALKALALIFSEQLQILRARFYRDHVVICGLGREGMLFAKELRRIGTKVAIIEKDATNGNIATCRGDGAVVLVGDAADRELLRKVRIERARHLISVTNDDGVNTEVALRARELTENRRQGALTGHIPFVDPQLCTFLRQQEIAAQVVDAFRLEFFNIFEWVASKLLARYLVYAPADPEAEPHHFLIVGMGRMGESLVVQAARDWNRCQNIVNGRIKISIIDYASTEKVQSFYLRYPGLEKICELIPLQMDMKRSTFQEAAFLYDDSGKIAVSHVFVCVGDEALGLSAALSLYPHLKEEKIPVEVRMTRNAGLADLLRGEDESGGCFAHLHPFGLLDGGITWDLLRGGTYEVLGAAIHREYVIDRIQRGIAPGSNPNMRPWEELPEEIRESNRAQASYFGVVLKAINCEIEPHHGWDAEIFEFTDEEIEIMARMEHNDRWCEEKRANKWRYAPGKQDESKRTHPYLVPWDELPEEVKDYDRTFMRKMPALVSNVGFTIRRK